MAPAANPTPRVSVVMPNHNGGPWLAEAVESVLAQTLADFELLVIDDGSTDDSRALLAGFACRDPRVRVLAQPRRGLTVALNRGLAQARAPLLARLDSDDIARPRRLERQVDFMDQHPRVGLVGSSALQIDVNGRPRGQRIAETRPEALTRALERSNPFVHSSIMARTDLMWRLGGYRCAFEAAEDYDLWLRLAEVAEIANLPEFLISYRMHDASVSRTKSLRQAFSVRLARGAAAARRAGGDDPTNALEAPPDWRQPMPAAAFYARDAALFRWLDRGSGAESADLETLMDALPGLNHAERRLAALSLAARIRSPDPAMARAARSLLLRLCRRRPRAVFNAVWSLRT
jgi:glycosyltransferase involved in cell wall biosynthesis